ncbi:ATP-dependent nuclease [Mucilaginibacter sp. McL0603]|uniref:ATP-dependent nuclease n=1 Tax=Mucilaginibacter sp. McL0603 TaxID=3415670 RepID=UPI003CEEB150
MDDKLQNIVNSLVSIKKADQFVKYIDFIQFPFYRNLEVNSKINFDFPLTVFIGQNGCGKSSALHAVYGTVYGKTPYEFWFDTEVDPIQYYDDEKRRHSFWYQFKNEKGDIVEVVKARIRRENDPNYWETSRPLTWAGMKKGDGNSRGKPIKKNVIYLDFREELSAFDKFFYFGNNLKDKARNRQEFIREKSIILKDVFSGNKKFIIEGKKKLNDPLHIFNKAELDAISFILGREYTSGKSIKHSIFSNEGYSVLFTTNFAVYSEAFAGSGEMAVVRLVQMVLNASEYSLILLDEPEVSLHPGAQARLKLFLLEQIKLKKHQIVITSHSPSIIKGLPASSIKVFHQNPLTGRFLIQEGLSPEEAFFHIEFPLENRKNLIVEDKLASEIIKSVLRNLGEATENLFNVNYNAGGQSVIKKEFISVFCRSLELKDYVLFDGDQKIIENIPDWKNLATSELTVVFLQQKVKEITGEDIKFSVDGGVDGGDQEQKITLFKKYLDFYKSNVFYLPGQIPEDIIWDDSKAKQLVFLTKGNAIQTDKIMSSIENLKSTKERFARLSEETIGSSTSENIIAIQKIFIQAWMEKRNNDYEFLVDTIHSIKN